MEKITWIVFGVSMLVLALARLFIKTESKKTESWIVVVGVLLITAIPMSWGFLRSEQRGPLDDPIMDQKDPVVQMDSKVERLQSEGLHTGDAILFVIPFYEGVSKEELRFVMNFSKELKDWFPEYGLLDLRTVTKYRNKGNEIETSAYLDESVFDDDWDMAAWKSELDRDKETKRFLIGGDYECALVRLLLPRGYDEAEVFSQVNEFLEQKKSSRFDYRSDIRLADDYLVTQSDGSKKEHVFPMGWCMARGLMTASTISDIVLFSSFGLFMVWGAFCIFFISFRQATIASSIIILSFIWIGGTVGIVQAAGLDIYLRIYITLVYSANIVSGISFAERKIGAYNRLRAEHPEMSRSAVWKLTRPVNELITITFLISFLNFITLYQLGISPVWEVGFLSASGILYLWILCLVFIPAMHIIVGGEKKPERDHGVRKISKWAERMVRKIVVSFYRCLDRDPEAEYDYRRPFLRYLMITATVFTVAIIIIAIDFSGFFKDFRLIEVRTKALEYIDETIVDRGYSYLESVGYGFESLNVLVQSKDDAKLAIEDVSYIAKVKDLQTEISRHELVQDVFSALDGLSVISKEEYGQAWPQDSQAAYDSFQKMGTDLGPIAQSYLWYENGIVLFVSVLMNDSQKLDSLTGFISKLAKEKYPELTVTPFGKAALWPKTDYYISTRKPENVMTSYWLVVFITALWVAKRVWQEKNSIQVMRPVLTGLAISLPFVFASSIMIIAMAVLRLPLDQATACTGSLAVSAAVDFGLYPIGDYQTAIQEGRSRREALRYALLERGEVVVIDMILNCICFYSLTWSKFLPVARLGWVMVAMLFACGFGSLVIMMSVLPCCVKEKQGDRQ